MKSLKTLIFGSTFALGLLFSTTVLADSVYTVKSGDTLSSISMELFGSNNQIDQIAKDNNIKNMNMIFPGQELTIKTDGQTTTNVAVSEPTQEETTYVAPQQETQASISSASATTSSAKEWIAQKESGGDYNATNGYHIGRYQLDPNYLNGDYSPANQEKVADQYVANRYGSWENAQAFWMNNGWY
ncbi:aggregation-promoting factor [Vagococcus sp. JNUCC 83]